MTVICRQIVAMFPSQSLVKTICIPAYLALVFSIKFVHFHNEKVDLLCLEAFGPFKGTPSETKRLLKPLLKGQAVSPSAGRVKRVKDSVRPFRIFFHFPYFHVLKNSGSERTQKPSLRSF